MNQHIKSILLFASILALLVSACDIESLEGIDAAGAPGTEPPPGAQIESRLTPTPRGDVGDADRVITLESIQTPIAPTGPEEPLGDADPEDIPSPEEREAILGRVNLGGPERPGSDEMVGEGPAPGTEMGPVNDFSSVEPEGNPGGTVNPEGPNLSESAGSSQAEQAPGDEDRDDILESVNPGGPARSGSDDVVGKGPEPETESDTERRFSLVGFLPQFIETLRNWWHELLS